jgi:hypothetical protein
MRTNPTKCGWEGVSFNQPSPGLLDSLTTTEPQLLVLGDQSDPAPDVAGIGA